jgi:FkbM family methyltransferase
MSYILFGAGTMGRFIARNHADRILCFADNDKAKWGSAMEGAVVWSPKEAAANFPDATWIASVVHPHQRAEILAELAEMGVKTAEVWDYLPKRLEPAPIDAFRTIMGIITEQESIEEFRDQDRLRRNPDTHKQRPPSDITSDITSVYFPDFITHRDDEHYVDCGAADGDTVRGFLKRWDKWNFITAFEPDTLNFEKLLVEKKTLRERMRPRLHGVSDYKRTVKFAQTGDYSAHIDNSKSDNNICAKLVALDDERWKYPPTYIKMDIEGSEPAALWGARRILKEHEPVLAICAYHESSHIWEIPLLIHALNPTYKLYLRRYLEAAWELIWYAVPSERVKQ